MATTIEVDFDVFKALTIQRESEAVTHNDVLRRLLNISQPSTTAIRQPVRSFVYKGVEFPEGTLFRATYKGRTHTAEIKGGAWTDASGKRHSSPSAAAGAITKTSVNGWTFWECKRPESAFWKLINDLR